MSTQQTIHRSIEVAVIERHARLANSLDVQPEVEFAERIWGLRASESTDAPLLYSFMDRVHDLRSVFAEVAS